MISEFFTITEPGLRSKFLHCPQRHQVSDLNLTEAIRATVETDKAVTELESVAEGKVLELLVENGRGHDRNAASRDASDHFPVSCQIEKPMKRLNLE